jgi:hypothetical protein
MVDIHSVAASSHPTHHKREIESETTSRSRAGRPRWASGHIDATTVMIESQPQRTASTTATPPVAVGIDTALLAACQLLNNPPSRVLPSAAEQWRHDVDQLIVTTINTSHHERRRQPSTQQSRTPSVACAPSLAHALCACTSNAAKCTPASVASHADGELHDGKP